MSSTPPSRAATGRGPGGSEGTDEGDGSDESGGRLHELRERIRRNPPLILVYRTIITVVGFLVIALGVLLLAFPGPGWLVIFLGLAILATEYDWSKRLLAYARAKVRAWSDWLGRQSIVVRALVGLVCLALIIGLLYAALWWYGTDWLPDWVPLVDSIPERT